jgi:predicted esterase
MHDVRLAGGAKTRGGAASSASADRDLSIRPGPGERSMASARARRSLLAPLFWILSGAVLRPVEPARSDGPEQKAPSAAAKGEVFAWRSQDGLPYEYLVPKSYDAQTGAGLTLVLHGNGLDQRWTFANHPAGKFRPDDIVVSPDGTTYHPGTRANEFLGERKDAERVHALIGELKKAFTVKQVFLYGHSQGSFFVFYYAGEYPEDVSGVVGHASGVWNWSKLGKFGHPQAIALLHGTDDANVPYGQSAGGRAAYREQGYPRVHLRTLWGWPHWPNWEQAQNQLAWCEGTTSSDPARVAACLETLREENVNQGPDFAALWAVAARLEKLAGASQEQVSRAAKARGAVEKVAASVAIELDRQLGKGKLPKVDGKPWMGLALRFLEEFDGVPACAAWAKAKSADLSAVDKVAERSGSEYWQNAGKDVEKAFPAAVDVLEQGWRNVSAPEIAAQLEKWTAEEKAVKAGKKELTRARTVLAAWRKGREEGFTAFEKLVKAADL